MPQDEQGCAPASEQDEFAPTLLDRCLPPAVLLTGFSLLVIVYLGEW